MSSRQKAKDAYDLGDLKDAIEYSTMAIEEDNTDQDMYALRGRSYIDIGSCELALNDVRKVHELSGEIGFLIYEGFCSNELGRHQEALATYHSILTADRNITEAWTGRARANGFLGKYDQARQDYIESIRREASDARVWNSLGMIYSSLDKMDSAVFCYKRSIDLNPSLWLPYYNLSIAFSDEGNYVAALEHNLAASRVADEQLERLSRERGKLYYVLDKLDSACIHWREALAGGDTEAGKLIKDYCPE